jgi:hypothetical protein
MVVIVEVGPGPLVGGHRHQEAPTGRQYAEYLGERLVLGLAVLDHVERGDDVEHLVAER